MRIPHGLAGLVVLLLAGCGSNNGPMRATGTVVFDGTPVKQGKIDFVPIEGTGGPSVGGAITDGAFDIPAKIGPRARGTYRVEISALRPTGEYTPYKFGESVPPLELLENYIPARYNRESILRATISSTRSKNKFEFNLEP